MFRFITFILRTFFRAIKKEKESQISRDKRIAQIQRRLHVLDRIIESGKNDKSIGRARQLAAVLQEHSRLMVQSDELLSDIKSHKRSLRR